MFFYDTSLAHELKKNAFHHHCKVEDITVSIAWRREALKEEVLDNLEP